MEIPKLLADMAETEGADLFAALIKPASIAPKDRKKDLLNVFMDFDLVKKKICFETIPYASGDMVDEQEYHYFGNNPAAAKQVYVVRDIGSILNFWFGATKGIMQNVYEFVAEGELKELLGECRSAGLFDEQGLCEEAFEFRRGEEELCFTVKRDKRERGLYLNGVKVNPTQLINQCLEIESSGKFVLVIPRIKKNGSSICISKHDEYTEAINASLQGEKGGTHGVCHVCGLEKPDISTVEYTAKLSKSSIGKVFVSTLVNYAPFFNKSFHQKNYSLCKDCYERLLFGEKIVMRDFRLRVAGEECVLLFYPLFGTLEKKYLPALKQEVDVAFNQKEMEKWALALITDFNSQEMEDFLDSEVHAYEFHMVFYRTDGKSTNIVKTIESISSIRFKTINDIFEKVRQSFFGFLVHFSLGHVYRLIPVSANAKGEQTDIGRVLNFYSAILKGGRIEKAAIFDFASEALDKGLRQLNSSQIRNYKNLNKLEILYGKTYAKDAYIAEMVMLYIALLEVLQELDILNGEVFGVTEEVKDDMSYPEHLEKMENFLKDHQFSQAQKKLFYMGVLTYLIGRAQFKQGHETKPILDKISYSGMTEQEILDFYLDLQEKVRQYKNVLLKLKILGLCEQIEGCVTRNLGSSGGTMSLSEKENVFFLKTGYSFCVLDYKKKDEKDKGVDKDDSSKE